MARAKLSRGVLQGARPPAIGAPHEPNHQGKNTVPRASLPWPKPTYRYFGGVLTGPADFAFDGVLAVSRPWFGLGMGAEPQRPPARSDIGLYASAQVALIHPFKTGCLPLNYSGNPGVR